MSKMRVLVLGATGYVGQHIVRALSATDWAQPLAASRHRGDLLLDATDAVALASAVREADAIVNAVSASQRGIVANAQALRTALAGTSMRLVHFSSMAVYGSVEGLIDESAPLIDHQRSYGAAKVMAERLLQGCTPELVVLRPGCIYGDNSPQWSARIERLLRAHRIGDLGSAGDGCSNLVYIGDTVKAVLAALQLPAAAGQTYNLSMAKAPSWNEYFIEYAHWLGATPVSRISGWQLALEGNVLAPMLKIAGTLGHRLINIPPPIPPSLIRLWRQDIHLVSDNAQRDLGLSWTPWRDVLRTEAAQPQVLKAANARMHQEPGKR